MASDNDNRILVLGVGNILLKDEGFGVRVVQYMKERCALPHGVSLVDGGTGGPALISLLASCDHAIIIDTVVYRNAPGSLYRISLEELEKSPPIMASAHQIGILGILALAGLEGKTPETVIIGAEPREISHGLGLTPIIEEVVPMAASLVLRELARLGVALTENGDHA